MTLPSSDSDSFGPGPANTDPAGTDPAGTDPADMVPADSGPDVAASPVSLFVLGFLLDLELDAVLLIRKKRPAWQAGRLNGLGGRVEAGESPAEAMAREFTEESGLASPVWSRLCTLVSPAPASSSLGSPPFDSPGWRVEVFRARGTVAEMRAAAATPPTDETLEVYSCSLLPPDVVPNLRWLLPFAAYTHDRYFPPVFAEVSPD